MKPLLVFMLFFVRSLASAGDITKSECVGPAGAPVKAIYMHGLFNDNKSAWYTPLEVGNRKKLEELAKKMNIRIAIPTAPKSKDGMYRWEGQSLNKVETTARDACGGHLDVPRALIGFSSGGYLARSIALGCDSKMKSSYSNIIMIGANARAPSGSSYNGCPKFSVMVGNSDGTNNKINIEGMLKSYKNQGGGDTDYVTYPGGHVLPPTDLFEKQLKDILGKASLAPTGPSPVNGNR